MALYTARDVVAVAEQWVGWHEEGNNGNPFDEVLAPYSGEIDVDAAWCDLFNDYCHFIASGCDAEHAQYVLCGPFDDYTVQSAQYYKDAGRWGHEPEFGAQVFFGRSGISHTGIVVWVDGDSFGTIEGNSGDQVSRHAYNVDDGYVKGFGYPRYDEESSGQQEQRKVDELKFVSNTGGDVYRLYNPNGGKHHFTLSEGERNGLVEAGWNYEGVSWRAQRSAEFPVYRMYNPGNGDHFLSTNFGECEDINKAGWDYEGVPFFTNYAGKPVYRVYNPNSGEHFYTASDDERGSLVAQGWNDEGIAFYGEE